MFTSALGLFSSDKDSTFLDSHHTGKIGDKNAPKVGEKFVEKGNYKNPVLKQFTVETSNAKHQFVLPYKFKITKLLGQGAYGVVVAGIDEEKKQQVAIKKIFNVFEQDREYQKRILREVKILKHFRNHENIVSLTDMVPPKNFADFKDVYIVTELMSSDLRAMIRSDQEFNEQDVQYFMYQILKGMKFIHSANVVHRDIKPANILLNNELTLKICDFGLSRSIDVEDPNSSTLYVATRWYRAPELLLVYEKSSKPMDMWSIGCVFAELLDKPKRKPLFPGESYLHQLDLILDVCGTPKDEDICGCDKAKKYVKNKAFKLRKDLSKRYPQASPLAIDLLHKMLTFNPHKRVSLDEALDHPFLKDLHDPEEEIVCNEPFTYNLEEKVPTSDIKKILYDDVMTWSKQNHQLEGDAIILDDHDNIIYVPSQLLRL